MEQSPLVSILVPIYGVEEYIEKCVRSLFSQSYTNIEYIFVNDCTKDNSINVLKNIIIEYPHRKKCVKIINHNVNKGLSAARETALNNCSGDFVWHIDSDDWISESAVHRLVQKATAQNLDVVSFNVHEVTTQKTILRKHSEAETPRLMAKNQLLRLEPFVIWSFFLKKSLFNNIQFDTKIGFGEDWALTPRVISNAKTIGYIEDVCYYYNRLNINSYTANIEDKSIISVLRAYDCLEEYFIEKEDNYYHDVVNGAKQNLYIHLLKMLISNKKLFDRIWRELSSIDFSDKKYIQTFNKPIVFFVCHSFKNVTRIYIKLLDIVKQMKK